MVTLPLLDSTKLKDFQRCPRYFFFKHILGWNPDITAHDLVFGIAWHEAKEHLLLNAGNMQEEMPNAIRKFMEVYRETYTEETDQEFFPKSPSNAVVALKKWVKDYERNWSDQKVLLTEIGGEVPITDEVNLYFKIDAIVENEKGICALDHKTTKMNSNVWRKQWELDFQGFAYTHALYFLYPTNSVYGFVVDGTVFKKTCEHIQVPVPKTFEMMQDWLWLAQHLVKIITWNIDELNKIDSSIPILPCFPKNPSGCMKYNRVCPFHSFCSAWPNPWEKRDRTPPGFVKEFWDPTATVEDAKYVLTEKGLEKKSGDV